MAESDNQITGNIEAQIKNENENQTEIKQDEQLTIKEEAKEEVPIAKVKVRGRRKEVTNTPNNISNDYEKDKVQQINEESEVRVVNIEDLKPKPKIPRKKSRKEIAESNIKLTEVFIEIEKSIDEGQNENDLQDSQDKVNQKNKTIKTDKKEKTVTNPPKEKKSKKPQEPVEVIQSPEETIIDLEQLNSKKTITNSEMILAILEICYNSNKFSITIPNNTREFWKKVYEKSEWENILMKFQSETLRKYWRTLRDIKNPSKIIELVKSYGDNFNMANVKLLPVINAISCFINSNSKSFDSHLKSLTSSTSTSIKKPATQSEQKLSKKRKREEEIEDDVKQISQIMGSEKKKAKIINDDDEDYTPIKNSRGEETYSTRKRSSRKPKVVNIDLTCDDLAELKEVDEIIDVLKTQNESKTEEEILDVLQKTSFCVEDTYLVLKDSNLFKGLTFEEPDDRTIKFLENSTTYNRLVSLKGLDRVEERKRFLKV